MFEKLNLLWNFMKGNRLLYLAAICAVGLSILFQYAIPLTFRITIDSIIGNQPLEAPTLLRSVYDQLGGKDFFLHRLWICALALLALTLLQGIFTYLQGRWAAVASEAITKNLRERLYHHLQRLPFSYHSRAETGDLIQRCTSDVETIRRFLAMQIVEVGRAIIMLGSIIPIMLMLDVPMTLVSMSVIPLIVAFAVIFFVKVKAAFQISDESEGYLSNVLQENLTGIRVVKAFHRQDFEMEKFDIRNIDFRDKTYRLIRLLAYYWSASDFLCLLQIAAALIFGAYWTAEGRITLGTLFAFITYISSLLWPVRQMGRILTDMGKALVSIGRLQDIFDEPLEAAQDNPDQMIRPKMSGQIEFQNVSFAYESGKPILRNISFTVHSGETVAILGPTGSGKTSLLNLLPRLYDYQDGAILLDGHNLQEIDRSWLRQQVGIVLQEPFLYSKTLRENIRLGRKNAEDHHVYDAATIANVHDVIMNFEQGYETAVGERGVTLSGGQKQRVAMARCILQDPPIILFDDTLSAVDNETDARIQRALKERKGQATMLIVSHRLTTISQADRILVLENGQITQEGTHAELLEQEGLYRRVWNIQSDLEADINTELGSNVMDKNSTNRKKVG